MNERIMQSECRVKIACTMLKCNFYSAKMVKKAIENQLIVGFLSLFLLLLYVFLWKDTKEYRDSIHHQKQTL